MNYYYLRMIFRLTLLTIDLLFGCCMEVEISIKGYNILYRLK